MIKEMLYNVMQSTDEYLIILQNTKKELKKRIKDLISLEKVSIEKGYQIEQLENDKLEYEIKLMETEEEIKKVRKVLNKLRGSLLILNGEDYKEESTEE